MFQGLRNGVSLDISGLISAGSETRQPARGEFREGKSYGSVWDSRMRRGGWDGDAKQAECCGVRRKEEVFEQGKHRGADEEAAGQKKGTS